MRPRLATAIPCAIALLLVSATAAPGTASAEHTVRVGELQRTGVDMWLVALTMGGAAALLIAFAAGILLWEHNQQAAEAQESNDSPVDES